MANHIELSDVPNVTDRELLEPPSLPSSRTHRIRIIIRKALRNVNVFVFFLSIYALIYGSLVTYLVAMITSIEKRFNIPSSKSGFVVGTTEIGYLLAVLPISHYGVKGHRPRILGFCGLLIAMSSFLWAMPFFIYGPQKIPGHLFSNENFTNSEKNQELCHSTQLFGRNRNVSSSVSPSAVPSVHVGEANVNVVLFFLIVGGILNGVGCTPFFNIGVTFVDDHVSKVQSSTYFGLLFCVRTIAPVIGFLIGGAFASIPEDFVTCKSSLTQEDPRFVAAWWLGFVVLGTLTAITSIPLLFFPRKLDKLEKSTDLDEEIEEETAAKVQRLKNKRFSVVNKDIETHRLRTKKDAIISFFNALKRMMMNPAIVAITLGATIDYFIVTAAGTFLPKYLEIHFGKMASTANVFGGGIGALAAAIGSLVGGFAMSRYPMSLVKLILYSTIALVILQASSSFYLFLSCPQLPLSGSMGSNGQWNFTNNCNINCGCETSEFQPVCGTDQIYLSPCAAGCSVQTNEGYSRCSCLGNATDIATPGLCGQSCEPQYIAFVVLSCIISILVNICYIPFCMVNLRCVHENDKSLAMAILSFFTSFVGIGGPSLYGMLIDNACLLFSEGDSGRGHCVLYDREKFRYLFNGATTALHIPSLIFYLLTYLACKRNVFIEINEKEIKQEAEKKKMERSSRL